MSATPLTKEEASKTLPLLDNKRGSQALQETIVAMRANRRTGSANTKSRNEVSGSGKKLWRQKGTGRARMGSVRSPIWVGGGVVFGPKPRDYSKTITKKVKKLALRRALTNIVDNQRLYTAEPFEVESGKTREFISGVRSFLPQGSVLFVGESFAEATYRAARNVQDVLLQTANEVNVEQLLSFKHVVVLGDAIKTLAARAS